MKTRLIISTVRHLMDFINEHCGTTDDWPMEINFDDEDLAQEFTELLNDLNSLLHNK